MPDDMPLRDVRRGAGWPCFEQDSTATTTSPWGAAPRPSAKDGSRVAQSLPSRKRRIAAALFYSLRDRRHGPAEAAAGETVVPGLPSISSPFLAHLGGAAHHARGRCAGGFQLGAVTAVRSPGDGGGAATAVEGGEELREAFNAALGEEEFLGLDGFRALADVRELLEDGLLRDSEVLAIWKAVPKADPAGDRVDFVGFSQAFARVDALFEEEEEEGGEEGVAEAGTSRGGGGSGVAVGPGETEASFVELVGSSEGVLDLAGLLRWSELTELFEEGLLKQEEVEQMWEGLPKVANRVQAAGEAGTEEGMLINLSGFLEFDRQLSDLFEDEEESGTGAADQDQPPTATSTAASTPPATPAAATPVVAAAAPASPEAMDLAGKEAVADEGTPEGQFLRLSANTEGVLTLDDLLGWTEVAELLEDDLMSREEVGSMFESLPKTKGRGSSTSSPAIDVKGFVEFARKLDETFEDFEEDGEETSSTDASARSDGTDASDGATANEQLPDMTASEAVVPKEGNAVEAKARLLSMCQREMADCGMGCGEDKRAEMLEAMEALLATEEGNLVLGDDLGTGLINTLAGEWRLLYTSSNAMEYNQGLTGLANTIPNAKFQGLRQILHADGMVFDAEYEEELVTGGDSEPLIITVTSDWEVKQTSSLVTGKSSVAISVAPKQIKYGFITVRSERWKTLRAMMLLDIAYLDANLRIMRGQTARQNFFVFVRV
ncbi:expressed unknown protein [Ectocarpus siliculosus]|uniref:Plastid lipid-associated protein/fibrillin conserved domain-containing protein n=1 Tax=Ectocarpus siliculosus TaxID=2880 RepID=D7FMY0_ECTSI|nr:expressed unknown protein [Ectocarpus siliculosus]|eukprot:CBJ30044.1 expressed unknown protein [Ectocarpus siliculosus]